MSSILSSKQQEQDDGQGWLISNQPTILFSQNKPATSNQTPVLFSQNKSAPATSQTNRLYVSSVRKKKTAKWSCILIIKREKYT
jgi:hypothetical protein